MNKKFIALLIFFFLISLTAVSAGNNTTEVTNPTTFHSDLDTVTALESGDSNISFSNGYKGYCVEWGEHSAEKGEKFYVDPTSKIINKETNADVSNYIKVMFLFFHNETQKNVIATQHMIWKFTNNKQFSKFNETWYNDIVKVGDCVKVPDSCVFKINATHECFFSFKTFTAGINEYQNYFGYKFIVREIAPCPTINITENSTNQNTTNTTNHQNNQSLNQLNKQSIKKSLIQPSTYRCGNDCWLLGCVIIMIIGILLLDNRQR